MVLALSHNIPSQLCHPAFFRELAARSPLIVTGLGAFLVYLFTLAPTVWGLDSAEFSAAAYNLGVAHGTGYPLYILLGKLFTYLPIGDIGYRLNLMSAVFASATISVVYLLSLQVSRRVLISMAAAGSLAFSYYFWAAAVVAEVYSLHAFLTATTVYLLLLWKRGGNPRLLYAAGFVWGLSFGNHMSTVLLTPAFAYLVVSGLRSRQLRVRNLMVLALCFLPTLAIYAYLPLRYLAEATPYILGEYNAQGVLERVDHTSIQGMWYTLTGKQFHFIFLDYQGLEYVGQFGKATFWLLANFLGIGLALGVLGIVRNYRDDPQKLVFLGLIFAANFLFFTSFGAADKEFMFLAAYI